MAQIKLPIKGLPNTAQVDVVLRYPAQQLDAQGVPAPEYRLRSANGGGVFTDLATSAAPDVPASGPGDPYPTDPVEVQITVTFAGRTRTNSMYVLPVQIGGFFDLSKPVAPLGWVTPLTLQALIDRMEIAADQVGDMLIQGQNAVNAANAAAERAEASRFDWLGNWKAGFYLRGSVVAHLDALWRTDQNTSEEPSYSTTTWQLLMRGVPGLPGVPGTVNGISAADLALYAGEAPHAEDPAAVWPRGVRTFDIRNGPAKGYPFDSATLTSYGADDGTTQQEALVTEVLENQLITTLWLRSNDGTTFRPWRKGTGSEGSLDVKRLLPSNRLINGSGELGTFAWTRLGNAVTYWGGYDEVNTGTVLEYYRVGNDPATGQPWAPLTSNTGVGQAFPYWPSYGEVYVTVDSVAQAGNARLYIDFVNSAGQIFQTVNEPLQYGIKTYGPYGTQAGGTAGVANIYLLHLAGQTGDILSRFRVGVGMGVAALPSDTRRSIRQLLDDLTSFKTSPATVTQLAENSRSSTQSAVDFPLGLSYMATGGSGWPFAGMVETVRAPSTTQATIHRQTIRQSGSSAIQHRTSLAASPFWSAWFIYAEKGTRGTKRFQDNGVPTAVNTSGALDGDEYLNLQNSDLFIRAGGVWPAAPAMNLRGLTGVSSYTRERRTGGVAGNLCVLVNGVWQVASPSNSALELQHFGLLGADGVMYGPGAEANVAGLGFDPGRNYYLGYPANGKNLYAFDSVIPFEAQPSQSQRLVVPGSTPRGVSDRFFLHAYAPVLDVEPVAQLYKLTPLSFPFDTDLGPAGLNEFQRNIDQPNSGQSTGGGASIRVRQDGFAGVGTSYDAVGAYAPSPHIDGSGRHVFLRMFEFSNTLHTYSPTDWPEADDANMLIAWQHHAVSQYRPGVGFVMTGDHTAPSAYLVQHTGTNIELRKRTMVNGVPTEVTILGAARAVASDTIYITRVSKQGSSIRVKTWAAPTGWHLPGADLQEPAAWDITRTDTSIIGSGKWGAMSHHDSMRIHAMSLATVDGVAAF